ncbi:polyglutamine-binding protein 1-like [Patiria miniata]|uniref:Polyglutamine-binding protein 1 n=1 Tax=Patiria miniata TaxID=46514 RepID=A0A914AVS2_PATMI|nr:polyglutamine-binding protein 1-like [Patiria miniata]XP_038067793.1 polyglutamine-binding protein 1-like [Patiria miniata]XP_038067794.1 polyglutamine-binding protein 1-like [Patiria miniata]
MPLPAALAARLKKRGIIQDNTTPQDPHEEILAQDYSDDVSSQQKAPSGGEDTVVAPTAGENLPQGWFKVKDHVSGYYYYWDADKDLVSWLSPVDPKAQISLPAAKLQEVQDRKAMTQPQPQPQPLPPGTEVRSADEIRHERPTIGQIGPIGPVRPGAEPKRHAERPSPYQKPQREDRDSHRQRRKKDDELDPMDPSAYSDTPRGNWSSGLPKTNEAKTGVDTTANGPLFQMRPYPNPGAVLRANAGKNPGN